ncbi:hypothetical protein J7F02_30415 [Streptomyces sp. ISL-112]|uniref:hypothetical protein n=1 Tax=Streptomyces sp. ISL-112 TaxID=2819176 RepID=UPI001BE870B5|nr:hypothetical protein [Streptomyces sp. ISL-112]MBT2429799.1 hypothetical protein [Streptomyces sp. ISL-112]
MTGHHESTAPDPALSSDSLRRVTQYQTAGVNARLKVFALLEVQGVPASEAGDPVAALEAGAVARAQCEVVELGGLAPASRGEVFTGRYWSRHGGSCPSHNGGGRAVRGRPLVDDKRKWRRVTAYASGDIVTTHTHTRRARVGTTPLRQRGALALLLAALATVSACTTNEPTSQKPTPPPSSSPPAPPTATKETPEEAAKKEAIAAYQAYWTELPKAFAVPAVEGTDLKRYAAADALNEAEETVVNLKSNGRLMTGKPVLSNPTVTGAELEKKTPNVSVSACLDVSKWKITDKKTGKPAPVTYTAVSKYVITSLLERWDGSWKVLRDELHADQPC